jgi:hypothetical protein
MQTPSRACTWTCRSHMCWIYHSLINVKANKVNSKQYARVTSFAFVALAGLNTHTCRSCSNNHLCILTPPPPFPTPIHQTPSSHISVSYYTRHCIMIYIDLCNCMLSKLITNNILLLSIIHILFRALCGRHVKREENFLHLVRCYVLLINITVFVCDIMQYVRKAPTFHRNLCFQQRRRWRQYTRV